MSEPNLSRRELLKKAMYFGIAALVGCDDTNSKREQTVKATRIEDAIDNVIPGTAYIATIPASLAFDFESGRLSGNRQEVLSRLLNSYLARSLDYEKLNYDANDDDLDIRWSHTSLTERCLKSEENRAQFARLYKNFNEVTLEDLTLPETWAKYSTKDIVGDDDNNQLTPGSVFAVRTSNGNYAKMMVHSYLPLKTSWKFWKDREKINNLHLKIIYVLYNTKAY